MKHAFDIAFRPTPADFTEIEHDDVPDTYVVACVQSLVSATAPAPSPLPGAAVSAAAAKVVPRDALAAQLLHRLYCDDLAELHEQFELA